MYKKYNYGLFINLITGLETIDKPVNLKQAEEAETVGLAIIKRSNDPNMNLYKFSTCGHVQYLQPTHVRRNNVKCLTCFMKAEVDRLYVTGHVLLHRVKGTVRKVRKPCGHVIEVQNTSIGLEPWCSQCFENELKEYTKSINAEYIGIESESYRRIRFKSCGHEKVVHQSQIQKRNPVCRICFDKELSERKCKEAEANGLTALNKVDSYYWNYKLPCGCIKILRSDHVRDNSWLCDVHSDSHYTKPSFIYLLRIKSENFEWLKLGYSKDINLRTSNYGLPAESVVKLLSQVYFDKGSTAFQAERDLHKKYKSYRLCRKEMQQWHKANGHTECYPVSLEFILMDELNKIERE